MNRKDLKETMKQGTLGGGPVRTATWVTLAVVPCVLAADVEAQSADATAHLRGQVVSAMTGGPLADARVVLLRSGLGAFTDPEGRFVIRDIPAGMDTVRASIIGFAEQQAPIRLQGGRTTEATFMLSRTVLSIEEINVTVEGGEEVHGKLVGYMERERRGHGFFIGPEDLAKRHERQASDILRTVPGLRVSFDGVYNPEIVVGRGQRRCTPFYWVDGQPLPDYHIDNIAPDDLLAIEVYRGASEIPPQFNYRSQQCAVMVIWTREGNRDRESYR